MSDLRPAGPVPARHRRCAEPVYVHITTVYALIAVILIAGYPVLPAPSRTVDFLLVSCGAVVPAAWAVRRRSSAHRRPWWYLLAALVVLNLGNVVWYWYVDVRHAPTGDGTIADLLISGGHVLLLMSAMSVVFRRGRNDVGGMIDAMIVSLAVGGLLWDAVMLPYLDATNEGPGARLSLFVDILILAAILGALLRLLLSAREHIPALWLLVVTLACSMAGNVVVALLLDPVTGARPDWTNMIFMGGYACLGLVALARSSDLLTRPGPTPADELTVGRLVFLGLSLAAIPVIGGGRQVFGGDVDGLLLGFGGAAVTSLVMVRVGRLAAERTDAERALLHQANHDSLTGLPNRREFVRRLTAELDRPYVTRTGPVVLFCDLDGFKGINDRFGHVAGDELLIEAAARLRRCVDGDSVVSRFGGDEFLILYPEATAADAVRLSNRISEALILPIVLDGEEVVIGASIGAVVADADADAERLIHRADALMYAAKQQRRLEVPGVRTVAA
ncbi:diguanylate cyclase domain-containing protein [Planosporangium sp. 12N6]|uniref:diguanylate cyclase domain-containing protein n=1 Tax=Planosporangium spinosum TaxID=3402278 RepID=UPI003CE88180